MCGLVGLAGDTVNMKNVFTELLLVDVVRGHHSTGAAIVTRDKSEMLVAKLPCASQYFVSSDLYSNLMKNLGLKAMIGHNRYATVGEKTADNAHPFQFENVVGAHNGTLDKWCIQDFDDGLKFGTDSEAIYYSINKIGLSETVAKMRGAWALTWYDRSNNTMNLLRNDKRPLFYGYSADRGTLFWASEAEMLEWVLARNNVKFYKDEYYSCEANKHYRWELPEKWNDKLDKPHVVEVKEKPRPITTYYGNHNHNRPNRYYVFGDEREDDWSLYGAYSDSGRYYGQSDSSKTSEEDSKIIPFVPNEKSKLPPVDTKKFRPPYKDHADRIVNKKEFEEYVSCGCIFCDEKDQEWGKFIKILKPDLDGRKIYLCEECYNDEDIRELIEHSL